MAEALLNKRRLTKKSRWSPTDLERQRLVVRGIALRCEVDLRTLAAARVRLVAAVRKQIGVPLALAGCFVAGMMVVPRTPPQRKAGTARRAAGRLRHITTLIRTSALTATAYSALFQGNRGSRMEQSPGEQLMHKNQVKGRAHEAKGKAKEIAGKLTGDKSTEHKGNAEKHGG